MDPVPTSPMCGAPAREARRCPDIDPSLRFDKGSASLTKSARPLPGAARRGELATSCPETSRRVQREASGICGAGRSTPGLELLRNVAGLLHRAAPLSKPRQLRNPDLRSRAANGSSRAVVRPADRHWVSRASTGSDGECNPAEHFRAAMLCPREDVTRFESADRDGFQPSSGGWSRDPPPLARRALLDSPQGRI